MSSFYNASRMGDYSHSFRKVKGINVFVVFYQRDCAVSQNRQLYDGTQGYTAGRATSLNACPIVLQGRINESQRHSHPLGASGTPMRKKHL